MHLSPRFTNVFDRLFTQQRSANLERYIVWLAAFGYIAHLLLIFLARNLEPLPNVLTFVSLNYLSALYTPFSFILFYEVFQLIISIPQSTTGSLGRQYEIISLIVLRNVFKDIAEFDSFRIIQDELSEFIAVLIDMGGSLLMFLLVAVFYHIRRWQGPLPQPLDEASASPELLTFVRRKKSVALFLGALLFCLAAYNLWLWLAEVYALAVNGTPPEINIKTIFYVDLFTVMIFTDVLILLFSMLRADDYKLVFRNAGFIVSTILIRFSLTIEKPYDVELALLAMIFGILVLLVYGYFRRYAEAGRLPAHGAHQEEPEDEGELYPVETSGEESDGK
ncbi:MAG: hypothetical protein AAGD01_11375 [Acidobacteriota bacterium]